MPLNDTPPRSRIRSRKLVKKKREGVHHHQGGIISFLCFTYFPPSQSEIHLLYDLGGASFRRGPLLWGGALLAGLALCTTVILPTRKFHLPFNSPIWSPRSNVFSGKKQRPFTSSQSGRPGSFLAGRRPFWASFCSNQGKQFIFPPHNISLEFRIKISLQNVSTGIIILT